MVTLTGAQSSGEAYAAMSVEATCRSLSRSIYLHSEQTTPDGSVKWGNTAPTIGARSFIQPRAERPHLSGLPVCHVHVYSAGDLEVFSFDTGQHRGFRNWRSRRNPAGERLVGIGATDIEECVAAFDVKTFATTPSTVAHSLMCAAASLAGITIAV
jgi:hypothetical protein